MERNKKILILLLILLVISCNNLEKERIFKKHYFERVFQHDSLFSHFPEEICNNHISYFYATPCNDYDCIRGSAYLLCKTPKPAKYRAIYDYMQVCMYNPANCFTIEELFADDPVGRYPYANRYVPGQLPVPRMESFDFGLGYREHEDPNYPELPVRTYNLPEDLEVHVIEADSGYFWKEKVEVFRPQELGPWKHGYSRGVALSEKEQMVGYWVMVW